MLSSIAAEERVFLLLYPAASYIKLLALVRDLAH